MPHLVCVPCLFSAFAFVGCGLGNLNVIVKQSIVVIIITTATNNNAATVASAWHAVAFIAM